MTRAATAEAPARARCESCGAGLSYRAWENGDTTCRMCQQIEAAPAATFISGPRAGAPAEANRRPRRAPAKSQEDLLDELIASLEAEATLDGPMTKQQESVKTVLNDIGFGQSSHELPYALWGFAGGFCANVALAKVAQVQSGAGLAEFVPAFLFGGLIAGAACAGIGWAIAKLRDKAPEPPARGRMTRY